FQGKLLKLRESLGGRSDISFAVVVFFIRIVRILSKQFLEVSAATKSYSNTVGSFLSNGIRNSTLWTGSNNDLANFYRIRQVFTVYHFSIHDQVTIIIWTESAAYRQVHDRIFLRN